MSPGGALVACASFREVVLVSTADRRILQRRRLGQLAAGSLSPPWAPGRSASSARPRGRCSGFATGVSRSFARDAPELHYLPQEGACDDVAFDPFGSRLAIVSQSGQVDVWEWRAEDA